MMHAVALAIIRNAEIRADRELIIAFGPRSTVPAASLVVDGDDSIEPEHLHQIFPRNTEPFVCVDTYEHSIRTTTQIIDGIMRMTMTDVCCDLEVVREQTLTEMLVPKEAGDAAAA